MVNFPTFILDLPNIYTLKEETVVGRNCRAKKLSRKVANDLNFLCVNCRGNQLSRTLENLIVAGINCRELQDE